LIIHCPSQACVCQLDALKKRDCPMTCKARDMYVIMSGLFHKKVTMVKKYLMPLEDIKKKG